MKRETKNGNGNTKKQKKQKKINGAERSGKRRRGGEERRSLVILFLSFSKKVFKERVNEGNDERERFVSSLRSFKRRFVGETGGKLRFEFGPQPESGDRTEKTTNQTDETYPLSPRMITLSKVLLRGGAAIVCSD